MTGSFEKIFLEFRLPASSVVFETVAPADLQILLESSPSYEQYKAWHNLVGQPYGWHLRARIEDRELITSLLTAPGTRFYLFQSAGKTVGYCLLVEERPGDVEISDFGFRPDETGKGFGSRFMHLIIAEILTRSPERIWLSTRSTNDPRVVNFYEKCGFRVTHRELHQG